MKLKYLALAPLLILFAGESFGCSDREFEQCWSVNLIVGTARDCKCFPKIDLPPPIQQANDEGKRLLANVSREVQNTPESINNCLSDAQKCVVEIISAPLALTVQGYIDGLYRQSEGRSFPFSNEFIALAQPYYSVDLHSITVSTNIDTGSGMSVSYCDRIFFAGNGSVWEDQAWLNHVLHEIEHTVQCQQRGKRTYLAEYVLKVGLDVLKTGRFDVHDMHDYEVAANAKADQVTAPIWAAIQNGAPRPQTQYASVPVPIPSGPVMNPVRFCQTQFGACQIPPAMVPMGTPCYCTMTNGQRIGGNAF
ncbi:hypothetical protein [Pseudomonas sp. DR48]|uniref:hypothetical protein n=1 Tax=Pseudomonas sp. DR48 TaxID=2871095 RepID=UPI001C99BD80|nr:hypothetical protein [Pseudomonas sp. DR48]QZP31488.1 hypothetical protein K5K95_25405 [Pseudomonas sp. DR48]